MTTAVLPDDGEIADALGWTLTAFLSMPPFVREFCREFLAVQSVCSRCGGLHEVTQ